MTPLILAFVQQPAQPNWFARSIEYLQSHALGVFMLLVSALTVAFLVQWILWAFGRGRFKRDREAGRKETPRADSIRFVVADALVKIINYFRHLLALIVVGIFAGAIVWALTVSGQSAEEITNSLQAVVSTLGGLVGSIIGYYFGEARGQVRLPDEDVSGVQEEAQVPPPPSGGVGGDEGGTQPRRESAPSSEIRAARPLPERSADASEPSEPKDGDRNG